MAAMRQLGGRFCKWMRYWLGNWKFQVLYQLARWIPAMLGCMRRRNLLSSWGGYDLCVQYEAGLCKLFRLNQFMSAQIQRSVHVFYLDPSLALLNKERRYALLCRRCEEEDAT